jgi:hypothetical protein
MARAVARAIAPARSTARDDGARGTTARVAATRRRASRARGAVERAVIADRATTTTTTTTTTRARGTTRTRAMPHAGDAVWWAEQAATCGAILCAYARMTRDGDDADEACPKCEGSGRTACSCTRWSGDGEGCGSCGYTGVTACPACRGGGRAVRVTVKIEAPSETSEGGFERDRSNATGSRATTTTTTTRARALRCVAVEGGTDYSVSTTPAIVDSTESKGPSGGRDEDGPSSSKDDDFYAQSGEAIRVLREDYPYLLTKEPRWTIYRDDIGLLDETMTFAGPGREGRNGVMATNMSEYKRVFKIIRIIAAVLFSQSTMEVSRIWSPLGSSGLRTIRVRWSVRGKVRLVGSIGADEARFDGISEYKLDSKGFIYEHKITDLDWDVAQLRERAVQMMRAAQGVQQPIGSGDW